jgi:hypothetical protein
MHRLGDQGTLREYQGKQVCLIAAQINTLTLIGGDKNKLCDDNRSDDSVFVLEIDFNSQKKTPKL